MLCFCALWFRLCISLLFVGNMTAIIMGSHHDAVFPSYHLHVLFSWQINCAAAAQRISGALTDGNRPSISIAKPLCCRWITKLTYLVFATFWDWGPHLQSCRQPLKWKSVQLQQSDLGYRYHIRSICSAQSGCLYIFCLFEEGVARAHNGGSRDEAASGDQVQSSCMHVKPPWGESF